MASLHDSAYSVCQEAMAMLRQEQTLDETSVLTGYKDSAGTKRADKVERACNRSYETARHEVLDSYGWSFCRQEVKVNGGQFSTDDGRYRMPYPGDALKILECRDESGRKIPFTVQRNEFIFTLEPAVRIVYIYDEDNIAYWSALARRALVCCLAKNLCIEISGRAEDVSVTLKFYNEAMENAKTEDATHTRAKSAYGGKNYIYECMTGRVNPLDRRML